MHRHSQSIQTKLTLTAILVASIAGVAQAAPVAVTAGGVSTFDNTNWVTNGLATLNGATSGVDWTVSGLRQGVGSDWDFVAGFTQGALASPTVEWPSAGTQSAFGYTVDNAVLTIQSSMQTDVTANGSSLLRISEVAPGAGVFSLNGVGETAASAGQVLEWTTPAATLVTGDTLTFSSNNASFSDGPIGFSAAAAVPEPSSCLAFGALLLLAGARRRARA